MTFRIAIIEVATIPDLPRSLYFEGANPHASIDVPCYSFLVYDGSRAALVDTGPDAAAAAKAGYQIIGDARSSLLRGLACCGVAPEDVSLIIHTHLHYDHVQNDSHFPAAEVIVQRAELEWAQTVTGRSFYPDVAELQTMLGGRLTTLQGSARIWPGLDALLNRGHTPGHQSVLVETDDGTACLCGDIVSMQANTDYIPPVCADPASTGAFLTAASSAGWEMIPSHEPNLRSHRWFAASNLS